MTTIKKTRFCIAVAMLLLLSVTFSRFLAAAVTVPPGGLAETPSSNGLALSFATTSPQFYTLQASSDLRQWTNCPPGVMGDGSVKTLTMTNPVSAGQIFYRLLIQKPTSLVLPQGLAFAILGHSCGGIQEHVSASFDASSGYPSGVVELSTSCGGSGRGGGYHTTTYTALAAVTWDFAGNVISSAALTNGAPSFPTTATDGLGDVIYNTGTIAYLVVPVPAAPTGVTAIQSNDAFQVSWTPNGANPAAITSSILTATPVNSTAAILTVTVTGSATSGIIPTLQPQTTYQVTVVNTTIGGSSPASTPISVTTFPANVLPAAPTGVAANWANLDPTGTTDTLIATWQAANPGNSPIDQYLVTIIGSDGAGMFTQTVSGTTLTAYFGVDFVPNWSVTVQAHNAAGWGQSSAAVSLGGL
jgi:hypothetical protein